MATITLLLLGCACALVAGAALIPLTLWRIGDELGDIREELKRRRNS